MGDRGGTVAVAGPGGRARAMNTTPPIATIGPTIIMMTFSRPFFDFCSS
ncbi:hypothetical protein [Actinomadura madurae]|nr:hypothetical protein [Actinomadura madurae]MCQ0008696.1 hypothetical protein [Actinomadura madurae]